MTEQPPETARPVSGEIVRWGVLRLLSGDLASDEEKVDAELDLDDFQFWFQEDPKHTGFKQILISLSGAQWGKLKELPLVEERSPQPPSAPASTGEQPVSPPAAVVDYTERARAAMNEADRDIETLKDVPGFVVGRSTYIERIAAALSTVASEHQAEIRDLEQTTEEVAYQAGVSDTLARLREPDLREPLARVICVSMEEDPDAADTRYEIRGWRLYRSTAAAALTKIAEMLK